MKASLENWSEKTVESVEFWLCPGMNDPELHAEIKHIYLLDKGNKKELKYTIRKIEKRNYKRVHFVSFGRPVKPGEKIDLEFEYTMKGKPDHSSTPIWQSKDGVKELFLRRDFIWCSSLFTESRKDVFPMLYEPNWKLSIEYPAGYVAVVDGELMRKEENDGVVKEEWKSIVNGYPNVFISRYEIERWTRGTITLEVYSADNKLLKKAKDKFDDYAKIFSLFTELYGHPGSTAYRIIASPVLKGGALGLAMGLVCDQELMGGTRYVAHEMAHTWWGTLVTSYGEGSKFLREAMAEFSSAYVMDRLGVEIDGESLFSYRRRRLFSVYGFYIAIADPKKLTPLIQQEGYDAAKVTAANYGKGPLVLNQVRLTLGDELFFDCLKAFASKYIGTSVNIYDFIDTINQVSGRDMTTDLKNMLWGAGYPSYYLVGFESAKVDGGYRTKVRIRNEGEYGLDCPLLLKLKRGEKREIFRVDGKNEREFVFTTKEKVTNVVLDPDLMAFQYHPQQKGRLWLAYKPGPLDNWGWYGKSYAYYLLGDYQKAVDTITEYLSGRMVQSRAKTIEEFLEKAKGNDIAYLFMRGVYYLALDNREHAEKDIKLTFPGMLEGSLGTPEKYYLTGVITDDDLDQYMALLSQIAGRTLSFEAGLDHEAKKHKVEEWKQWWEKEGKHQKLDLKPLKEQFEAHRKAHLQQEG